MLRPSLIVVGLSVALNSWGWTAPLRADDFHIDTDLYSGSEKEPVATNVTLSHAGKVYDFQDEPEEVTIFDAQRQQLFLLDPARRVKAEIPIGQLTDFESRQRVWAAQQDEPLLRFAADPQFDRQEDPDTGAVVWSSAAMTYRVVAAKAKTLAAAQQYREFSDLYARLNSFTQPGSPPALPRLQLNANLCEQGQLPQQVELTLPRHRLRGADIVLRTEHRLLWRLSEADIRRIDEAGEMLVTFTPISVAEYLRPVDQARRE